MSSPQPKPPPLQPTMSKLEALLLAIGRPGRRQVISTIFLLYAFTHGVSMNYLMSFTTMTPSHRCKLPADWPWPENVSIPHHYPHHVHSSSSSKLARHDSCHMYVDPSNHSLGVRTCPNGYTYRSVRDDGIERHTVSSEWDLVCDHKYLVRVFQLVYFVGVLLGGIIGGYLCDTFGRRTVWVATDVVFFLMGLSTYMDVGFAAACIFMFFLGMSMQSMIQASIALALEMFPSQYRTMVGVLTFASPGISYGYATMISYFVHDWRSQIALHSLLTLVAVPGMWLTSESMRWLLAHRKDHQAVCACRSIARFNGLALPPSIERDVSDVVNEIQDEQMTSKKQTIVDLLRYRCLRNYSFIMGFTAFTAHLSIYGFSFLMSEIGGDIYRNSMIVSVLDTVLRFASYFILKRCGRKKMTVISMSIMGIMQATFITLRLLGHNLPTLRLLSIVASITGRVFNGIFFCSFYILIVEVFPTTVRSTGQGMILACGRAGLMSTPIVLFLSDYIWKQMPFAVFGVMGLISALLCTFLPETKNRPLPNTIEEAVKLSGEKSNGDDSTPCRPQLILKELVPLKTVISSEKQ